jgi:hypothetical protein
MLSQFLAVALFIAVAAPERAGADNDEPPTDALAAPRSQLNEPPAESLPAPRSVPEGQNVPEGNPQAMGLNPAYFRRSRYDVWQLYAVDQHGFFRARVMYTPVGAYYLYNGAPFPWVETHPLEFMPYADFGNYAEFPR